MTQEIYDLTILGGGPTGLFGAFYAGMRHMKTLIIDALPDLGGQLTALYPEKYVYDVGGFPKILAKDLAHGLVEQGLQFEPTVQLNETAAGLERADDAPVDEDPGADVLWRVTTDLDSYVTRTVVIAAGIGAFRPRKLKKVPEVETFEGRGVEYLVKDRDAFAGQHVLIVGGGDSACDWAVNLEGIADSITLIHRREGFRAHEGTVKHIKESEAIEVMTHWEVRSISGNDHLETVKIFDNRSDEERTLSIDTMLINIGYIANLGAIKEWGIEMVKNDILVNDQMETNLPGVYAAGDVTGHPGKLDLIATGFGEAAIAVNFAKTRLDPEARAFPGHSSEEKWH